MTQTHTGGTNDRATAICNGLLKISGILAQIFGHGIRRFPYNSLVFYVNLAPTLYLLYALALGKKYVAVLSLIFPAVIAEPVMRFFLKIGWPYHFGFLCVVAFATLLFCLGFKAFKERQKYQRAVDCLSLKSGLGTSPKLVRLVHEGEHRLRATFLSEGVGLDRYESRKSDLEAAFGANIEGMKPAGNPKFIEITLAKRKIPSVCYYKDLISGVHRPYSLLLGESFGGTVIQGLRELPHMLIAGTTGGGKSVFFKQALVGLMRSSPSLQMYLLDLKGGVEMKEFSQLPNVTVAKNEKDAVNVLRRIKAEMERRFKYMEEKGYKKIEPERDKMDVIVVGVDEASVLYTKPSTRGAEIDLIAEARDLTESLAKLSRAAAIHLILATQKVTKETVPTSIQENIGGRMCFRMNTLQGSLTILGNKMAFELPDQPGRAIWSAGNQFVEIQAPLLSEEEILRELEVINFDFESGKRRNYQDLLTATVDATSGRKKLGELTADHSQEDVKAV